MNSKSMVLVVAAILAVAAVGVVVYNNLGDDNEADIVKILIQDEEGVYFWIGGEGDDAFTALADACEKFEIPLVSSDSTYGKSIDSVFGIGTEQVEPPSPENEYGVWAYWSQYSFIDGEWGANEVSIDQVKTSEIEAIALVYSSTFAAPLVTPSDAKIWNHSTSGTVFTIESPSGIYFKVNGTGDKVIDAFINATDAYDIPFVPTGGDTPTGISSLFGIEMAMVEPISEENPYGVWHWWVQNIRDEGGTGWINSSLGMGNLVSSETPEMKIIYGSG